jgi:hypothetical protein
MPDIFGKSGHGPGRATVGSMARVTRRVAALAAALMLAGCLSPTLPLPPPSKPTIEGPDPEGNVTLSGRVESGAEVYAANLVTGEIRGQMDLEADGWYEIRIPAKVGDEMALWYTMGTDKSPSIVFVIPDPAQ